MLTCCNVTFSATHDARFQGVGISLLPGSLLGVYGAQGKTAFLNLMAGYAKPTAGEVTFEGKPVLRNWPKPFSQWARNKEYTSLCLYISQPARHPDVKQHWTVEQTVIHNSGIHAEPLLLTAALRYFGLDAVRETPCSGLSQTLAARVKLACLLTLPRAIWILDEPDTGLDDEGCALLYRLISDRCNQDGIVIMASEIRGTIAPCASLELEDFA